MEPFQQPEPAVRHLERELEVMKVQLRDSVEQYEANTEELKASNEELQAMNEELRSASEELETSREELQSINDELTTVDQELKSKLEELGHANSDLRNLMASTAIPTIFLDRKLRITRYTPSARRSFSDHPQRLGTAALRSPAPARLPRVKSGRRARA
jgi:two-component system CheB/CheR fusion protein